MSPIAEAQDARHFTNEQLGRHLGVSRRTVQRWYKAGAGPTLNHAAILARSVHPTHPDLAHELAIRAGTTLEGLGLVQQAPPPPNQVDPAVLTGLECALSMNVELSSRVALPRPTEGPKP